MKSRLLALLLISALAAAGCGKQDKDSPTPSGTHAPSGTSPLTGLPLSRVPDRPAYVVKIENTDNGAPQYGLNDADLVAEELVEGGLTRLAAIYYSALPTKVGHVRSARGTDVDIAAPLHAAVVASGAARYTYSKMSSAGLTFLTEDRGAKGFSSDPAKSRPYNRLLNLAKLAEGAKKPAEMSDYFAWSDRASGGKPVSSVSVRYSGVTTTKWVFKGGLWRRANGHAAKGQDFAAQNLVVIFAREGVAGYRDPAGNPVPELTLEGSGKALVLNGNRAQQVTWTKTSSRSTVRFRDAAGKAVALNPGKVWLALAPAGSGSVTTKK